MPWKLERSGDGYKVITKDTGRSHSKKPMSKRMATRQLRALYASEPHKGK